MTQLLTQIQLPNWSVIKTLQWKKIRNGVYEDQEGREIFQEIMTHNFISLNAHRSHGSGISGPICTAYKFEHRFRVPNLLLNKTYEAFVLASPFMKAGLNPDETQKIGIKPRIKIAAVIRMISYGIAPDFLEKILQIEESNAFKLIKEFCKAIVSCCKEHYLRRPNAVEIINIKTKFLKVGFPSSTCWVDFSSFDVRLTRRRIK